MTDKEKLKPSTLDIEIACVDYFNARANVIVPNVSWGIFSHKAEVDLCILSKSSYATEVEIKADKYDLIKDKKKAHGHHSHKIKYLYFAIPKSLLSHIEHVPERAGILTIEWVEAWTGWGVTIPAKWKAVKYRKASINSKYQWTEYERQHLTRLGCMRIWTLKKKLAKALINV